MRPARREMRRPVEVVRRGSRKKLGSASARRKGRKSTPKENANPVRCWAASPVPVATRTLVQVVEKT